MLPLSLIIICPECRKPLNHTILASTNSFNGKQYSDGYKTHIPARAWTEFVMCPYCKAIFNFRDSVSDQNKELLSEKNVIYDEVHLYKKLMLLKNVTEAQKENILLGYVWKIDHAEPELLKKDDILEDYQKCCREIAEMFSKRDSAESQLFVAEYLRKIGEFGKAKNILLRQTSFVNEMQKTIAQGIIQMCDEQRKEPFRVS